MSQLTRPKYAVALAEDPFTTLEVEVTPADQFRAELEASKWHLPSLKVAPMQNTAMWVFCAMRRTGLYAGDWPTFSDRDLHAWEAIKDENDEPIETPVDPTREPSGSASPSPSDTPEPPTGSTPTSTPA